MEAMRNALEGFKGDKGGDGSLASLWMTATENEEEMERMPQVAEFFGGPKY